MAKTEVANQHPMIVGLDVNFSNLRRLYSQGIYTLAKISDIVAIPMFWHIGCGYRQNGSRDYKYNESLYVGSQVFRTLIPTVIAMIGLLRGDQGLLAVGVGFTVGGLIDTEISSILVTGIRELDTQKID